MPAARLVGHWSEIKAMVEVGAYEAKTRLSELLERVRQGERIVITRHGQPIAELGPISHGDAAARRVALERMRRFREQHRLKGETIRELIEDGRRY